MAFVTADRVRELSITSGTGPMFLGGPVGGYQSFADGVGVGNSTFYAISIPNGAAWEVGVGTVAVGSLSRDTVLSSSNGGAKVSFPAGTKDVFATFAAAGAVVGVENTIQAPAGTRLPVANGGTGVATVEAEVSRLAGASNVAEIVQATDTATTTTRGIVEFATSAETLAGDDATRAVTPAGMSDVVLKRLPTAPSADQGPIYVAGQGAMEWNADEGIYVAIGGGVLSPVASFKNGFINGDFSGWQRGTSFTLSGAGQFTADRFAFAQVGQPATVSREVLSPAAMMDFGSGSAYGMRVTLGTPTQSSSTRVNGSQRFEGVSRYAGQRVTLSLMAANTVSGATPKIGVEWGQNFGVGGSPTVSGHAGIIEPGNFYERHSITFDVPSIVGKSMGRAGTDFFFIGFFFSAGSDFPNAGGIGIQTASSRFGDLQIEPGDNATKFDKRPEAIEMMLCHRFTRVFGSARVPALIINASGALATFDLYPPMRVPPSVSQLPGSDLGSIRTSAGTYAVTAINGMDGSSSQRVVGVTAPGLVTGTPATLHGGGYLFESEL